MYIPFCGNIPIILGNLILLVDYDNPCQSRTKYSRNVYTFSLFTIMFLTSISILISYKSITY